MREDAKQKRCMVYSASINVGAFIIMAFCVTGALILYPEGPRWIRLLLSVSMGVMFLAVIVHVMSTVFILRRKV